MRLHLDPSMKLLSNEIGSFLCAASRLGHVFIVTASANDFVRKCCRLCFPELLKVLDSLKVTILYARPCGDAAQEEPVERWKEAVFRTVLQGPFIRPLIPSLARFYESDSVKWKNILSYGDQWTDHTALRSAADAVSPMSVLRALLKHRRGGRIVCMGKLLSAISWRYERRSKRGIFHDM